MELQAKKLLGGFLVLGLAVATASAAPDATRLKGFEASVLQKQIDQAKPGDTIRVPAGVYHGSLKIEKKIALIGAGPGRTIFEGDGAERVVLVDAAAVISKVTIRGGRVGIEFRGPSATLQDSVIAWNDDIGVHCLADPIVFNNRVFNNNIGIAVNSRAPILLHNTISNNKRGGVWSWYAPGPALIHNLITHNLVALDQGAGSRPEIVQSVEWGNSQLSRGLQNVDPGFEDAIEAGFSATADSALAESVELSPLLSARKNTESGALYPIGYLGKRRAEVELNRPSIRDYVRRNEPKLTYRLTPEPGVFRVEVTFSKPGFQMGSSDTTTGIEVIKVWDTKGKVELHAEVRKDKMLGIQVSSMDPDAPAEAGRYRLEAEFVDPQAWRLEGDRMVFERKTSLENSEIIAPEGWTLRMRPDRKADQGRILSAVVFQGTTAP